MNEANEIIRPFYFLSNRTNVSLQFTFKERTSLVDTSSLVTVVKLKSEIFYKMNVNIMDMDFTCVSTSSCTISGQCSVDFEATFWLYIMLCKT